MILPSKSTRDVTEGDAPYLGSYPDLPFWDIFRETFRIRSIVLFPMPKRARDQLTGGTNDVNPQYLQGSFTLSAANTLTEVTVGTPIVRVGPATEGSAVIMELIKLFVDFPAPDAAVAAQTDRSQSFAMSTASSGATPAARSLGDPSCLARVNRSLRNAFTAAGTGILDDSLEPTVWDFTDGAGHGVLVATDNLYFQAATVGQAAASTFAFKLMYRFKKVSLAEYIGIVQSQQ